MYVCICAKAVRSPVSGFLCRLVSMFVCFYVCGFFFFFLIQHLPLVEFTYLVLTRMPVA